MKLLVIAVGTRMPAWVMAGFSEYARRMPPHLALQLCEIRAERGASDRARVLDKEGKRIAAAMPRNTLSVVLDEHGEAVTSRELAQRLADWQASGRDPVFIIGGAEGLAEEIKSRADWSWSLSPLTLPHALVRIIVAEQLYRAATIACGHPYHRD